MKRKTTLKFIAVCLIFTFFCNMTVLAVGTSTVGTVGKISENLSAKLAEISKDEKISAYVFFKDESEVVLSTMRTSHAELFTTYTAAKGIAPAAELMTASATDTQRTAAVDGAKLQEAIEVKRQLYRSHYSTANSAVLEKHCEDEDILFVSSYAPMAIVTVTARELKALALDASVERIDLFENHEVIMPVENDTEPDTEVPPYIEEHWNLNSRAEFTRDAFGLTGDGVKIGQVELGLPYVDDQLLADATIITNSTYGGEEWESIANENHATNVARIMVGTYGVARDATLYSACVGDTGSLYEAIEWLIAQGVNVINMSMSIDSYEYDSICAFVDHIAVQHDVHFVTAVGNVRTDMFGNLITYISSPALAYNAIVVGAYNDKNSVPANDSQIAEKQEDDELEWYSKYTKAATATVSNNKPHLVATGNYFWNDSDAEGTSYAAPQVTGVIAQLCGYDSSLKTKQTAMGAILMASCGRKLLSEVNSTTLIETYYEYKGGDFANVCCIPGSNNQISDTQGAGKLDAYWAYTVAMDNNFWSLTLDSSVTTYEKNIHITASSDALIRISAFWLKRNYVEDHEDTDANGIPIVEQMSLPNWDLTVYGPNNQIVASSTTTYNNYEVVQFQPTTSGTYTIKLTRPTSSNNGTSYVGLAVGNL